MQVNYLWLFLTLLVVNSIDLSICEPKRSFGFGRSRPKSNSNLSVRRRGHLSDTPKNPAPVQKQTHTSHASSHTPSAPQGPPPAYSAGPSAGKTNLNAAPPAYTSHGAAPPSYSTSMGHGKYPQQSYTGVNSGPNLHQSAPNYGWNAQSHGSFAHQPSYGGYNPGGFSGMPNYGGYGGMMGGGMMGGGMGVQPIYVQQKKPSLLGGVAGYALTGLAGYQLARALGGGGGYGYGGHDHYTTVHHHYHNAPESANTQMPTINQNTSAQQATQQAAAAPQTPYSSSIPYNPDVPQVPLAPLPSEIPSDCKENCTSESTTVTSMPEIDNTFPYPTIHPSLFLYASQLPNKDLEYWAKSVDKKLNSTDTTTTAST